MYVVCVNVWVKEEFIQPFIDSTMLNARGTRQEPGNLRFDVCQSEDDPAQFFLYEMYRSKEDFQTHQQQPHYFKWRETVEPWMAQKRQGIKYHTLFCQ